MTRSRRAIPPRRLFPSLAGVLFHTQPTETRMRPFASPSLGPIPRPVRRPRAALLVALLSAPIAGCGSLPSQGVSNADASIVKVKDSQASSAFLAPTAQAPVTLESLGKTPLPMIATLTSPNDPMAGPFALALKTAEAMSTKPAGASLALAAPTPTDELAFEAEQGVDGGANDHAKSDANAAMAASGMWPAEGADLLAALSPTQLFHMPELFDSCPTSPEVAKAKATAMRDRLASQAVLAKVQPGAVDAPSVQSLSALFAAREQMSLAANALGHSRERDNLTMKTLQALRDEPLQGGRLSVGALAFDIHRARLAGASGVDDWRDVAASGLKGNHWAFNPASMPLGVRNRNFGNLRDRNTGGFQQFDTFEQGIHAADMNLLDYGIHHNINTINGIINRWAPAGDGDNNPNAYAAAVSKTTGIAVDDVIDLRNARVRQRILAAMFDVESPGWRVAMQQSPTAFAALVKLPPRKAPKTEPATLPASEAQPPATDDV